MKSRRAVHLAAGLLFARLVFPTPARAAEEFPPFKESEFQAAGLAANETSLQVDFPTAAIARGVTTGRATVSVLIDADGQPLDFLVTMQTDPAFGQALLEKLQTRTFQPAKLRGRPIPARCGFSYQFETQSASTTSSFSATSLRNPQSKLKPFSEAVAEARLDRRLELIGGNAPTLPPGVALPGNKPVKVLVSFFVDETGQVRVPQVESAPAPELVAPVVAALSTWTCKPPVAGRKPALVLVSRPVPVSAAP